MLRISGQPLSGHVRRMRAAKVGACPGFLSGCPLLRQTRAPRRHAVCAMSTGAPATRPAPGVHTLYVKAGGGGNTRGDCPFSAKAMLALRVKNIDFEERWIDLADKPEWYLGLNPVGTTPTLVAPDAEVVASSDEIVALADEVGPADIRLYREDSEFWEAAAKVIAPVFGAFARLMKNKDESEEPALRAELANALKAVDAHLERCGGPYLLGEELSAMDLNLGPKLQHIIAAGGKYRGVDISEYANLQRLYDVLCATDAWSDSMCADEQVVTGWSRFFG